MRLITSLAAVAAVAFSMSVAPVAFAADPEEVDNWTPTIEEPADTVFDLGIDVAPLTKSPAAVRAYLSSLTPVTRNVLLSTCQHYMLTPNSTVERETLEFCSIAVGG
jgi:hypothetical protein